MAARINQLFPIRAIGPSSCLVGRDRFTSVCEARPVNFGLRSQKDQERLVNAYAAFLNGLSFPVEILVRSDYVRIDDYLGSLKSREEELEAHLRPSLGDYIEFLRDTANLKHLVKRRFFVVLSWQGSDSRTRPLRRGEVLWDEAEMELERRRDLIAEGLKPLGIRLQILEHDDLFRFLYASLGSGQTLPPGTAWVWQS
jgi:hypothetical protein